MRTKIRTTLTLAIAAMVATTTLSLSTTTALASNTSHGTEACQVVLHKLKPGQETSDVAFSRCSDNPDEFRTSGWIILANLYVDADYRGRVIYLSGLDGPCDSAGYGWRDLSDIAPDGSGADNTVSSFRVLEGCTWSQMYDGVNYSGDVKYGHGNYAFIGHEMNDRMSSMILHA
ncbi:hypothetical protein [Amycolatopsis magusensis]|uniref:hypothetical protein n=1 Tax=Amycolatopsis magusensis TaxID=882444 RepID=UPI0024A7C5DA|nr:hypothetical protein [Amycolatopsis magusensis]MDI5979656.1 hypothetical protein [Amycolatopsis magusensis]